MFDMNEMIPLSVTELTKKIKQREGRVSEIKMEIFILEELTKLKAKIELTDKNSNPSLIPIKIKKGRGRKKNLPEVTQDIPIDPQRIDYIRK